MARPRKPFRLSFETAKAQYVHRYTLEHVPAHVRRPCEGNGHYYAPQFASDREWYDHTTFPGEAGHLGGRSQCFTSGQTWPLGKWLRQPFPGLHVIRQPGEPYGAPTAAMIERARKRFTLED